MHYAKNHGPGGQLLGKKFKYKIGGKNIKNEREKLDVHNISLEYSESIIFKKHNETATLPVEQGVDGLLVVHNVVGVAFLVLVLLQQKLFQPCARHRDKPWRGESGSQSDKRRVRS